VTWWPSCDDGDDEDGGGGDDGEGQLVKWQPGPGKAGGGYLIPVPLKSVIQAIFSTPWDVSMDLMIFSSIHTMNFNCFWGGSNQGERVSTMNLPPPQGSAREGEAHLDHSVVALVPGELHVHNRVAPFAVLVAEVHLEDGKEESESKSESKSERQVL